MEMIIKLKENGDIFAFELKKEGLLEVFDYIVHQTDTELIVSQP